MVGEWSLRWRRRNQGRTKSIPTTVGNGRAALVCAARVFNQSISLPNNTAPSLGQHRTIPQTIHSNLRPVHTPRPQTVLATHLRCGVIALPTVSSARYFAGRATPVLHANLIEGACASVGAAYLSGWVIATACPAMFFAGRAAAVGSAGIASETAKGWFI